MKNPIQTTYDSAACDAMQQKEASYVEMRQFVTNPTTLLTPDAEPDGPPPHGSRRSGSVAGYAEPRKQGK